MGKLYELLEKNFYVYDGDKIVSFKIKDKDWVIDGHVSDNKDEDQFVSMIRAENHNLDLKQRAINFKELITDFFPKCLEYIDIGYYPGKYNRLSISMAYKPELDISSYKIIERFIKKPLKNIRPIREDYMAVLNILGLETKLEDSEFDFLEFTNAHRTHAIGGLEHGTCHEEKAYKAFKSVKKHLTKTQKRKIKSFHPFLLKRPIDIEKIEYYVLRKKQDDLKKETLFKIIAYFKDKEFFIMADTEDIVADLDFTHHFHFKQYCSNKEQAIKYFNKLENFCSNKGIDIYNKIEFEEEYE